MDSEVLRLLEFPAVQRILADFASSGPGQQLALRLAPFDTLEVAELELTRTAEMIEASKREFKAPLSGIPDVRQPVQRAAAGGGPLEPGILWHIGTFSEAANNVGRALDRLGGPYSTLSELGAQLPRFPSLETRIRATIDASGTVKDEATPQLAELRKRMKSLRRTIEDTLIGLVHSPAISPHLQYPNLSLCRGRFVLPVNARQKGRIRGILHGVSDSGATVYVEPMQTVELGNRLMEAESTEEEVVREILWDLTRQVAQESQNLLKAQDTLAIIDLTLARARMAMRYTMSRPILSRGRTLELHGARHPALLRMTEAVPEEPQRRGEPRFDAVVPLDLHLGDEFNVLVVTGPNTGGKTVVMKTVGLLCLMAQAGLYVPAERALVPFYDRIYADIGDEQSLEQSLSTFSAHMLHIITMLNSASSSSLVLLDDLGVGTDPIEGGALAQAVLNELVRRCTSAIVTTHLGQLKTFAAACPDAQNACVEFDSLTLRPTYHLTIGTAGRSNALEIAERLGLPASLIADARARLDQASAGEYGNMLDEVRVASKDAEERLKRARWVESEAERLREQYEQTLRRIKEEEERTGADIGLKIRDDLERVAEESRRLYDELRFAHKPLARRMRDIHEGLREVLQKTEELLSGHRPERPIKAGDEVYVVKVHKWGEVARVDNQRKRALVNVGEMQMELDLSELVPWGTRQDESRGVP